MDKKLSNQEREVWQRGPVEGIPALLQPVAHAILQVGEDASNYCASLSDKRLWLKPDGLASAGFHLQHIAGVLDRLFTYAAGETLTELQLTYLKNEANPGGEAIAKEQLLDALREKIHEVLQVLKETDETTLLDKRYLGREKLPTTKLGLMFHAAEHAQRHMGQLLVTVRWVSAE
jgi:uncharacterized damage-inducible protein DinB